MILSRNIVTYIFVHGIPIMISPGSSPVEDPGSEPVPLSVSPPLDSMLLQVRQGDDLHQVALWHCERNRMPQRHAKIIADFLEKVSRIVRVWPGGHHAQ